MKKGFTLVELLAVVALLSIIIVIAVPSVTKLRQSALERERNTQIKAIESAAILYAQDNKTESSVTVNKLLEDGYMNPTISKGDNCIYDAGCILDPLNGDILNLKNITITRTNGKTKATYNNN